MTIDLAYNSFSIFLKLLYFIHSVRHLKIELISFKRGGGEEGEGRARVDFFHVRLPSRYLIKVEREYDFSLYVSVPMEDEIFTRS